MSDADLIARIAAVLPAVQVSQVVDDWPEDERELYRTGVWHSFTERADALDQLRREKAARKVLEALREAGALRGVGVVVHINPPPPRTVFVPYPNPRYY